MADREHSLSVPTLTLGPVSVYFGANSGKYPDGNQVVVRGRDAVAAFDTPLVANRLGPVLEAVDLVSQRFLYPADYADVYIDDAERKTIAEHLAELTAAGEVVQRDGIYRRVRD